jgi:hypothetical protein
MMPRESTKQTKLNETNEKTRSFRLFRYFRLFRTLFSGFPISSNPLSAEPQSVTSVQSAFYSILCDGQPRAVPQVEPVRILYVKYPARQVEPRF